VTFHCPFCGAELEVDGGGMWCPDEEVFVPDSELIAAQTGDDFDGE
jgi:hypothetical protein